VCAGPRAYQNTKKNRMKQSYPELLIRGEYHLAVPSQDPESSCPSPAQQREITPFVWPSRDPIFSPEASKSRITPSWHPDTTVTGDEGSRIVNAETTFEKKRSLSYKSKEPDQQHTDVYPVVMTDSLTECIEGTNHRVEVEFVKESILASTVNGDRATCCIAVGST